MAAGQVPIFIINLDRSPDRFERIAGRLSELGLDFERLPAVDGRTLTKDEIKKINPKRSWLNLSDSEVACYMSHLKAIRLVLDRELPRAIILEDDVIFDKDFPVWASSECPLPDDLELLKLEGFGAHTTIKVPISSYANRTIRFSYKPTGGAAAYLITLNGARKILDKLNVIRGQLDYDLFTYWKTGLRLYEVFPFPAEQDGTGSTIAHTHYKRPLRMRAMRWALKSADKAGRLYYSVRWFGVSTLLAARR